MEGLNVTDSSEAVFNAGYNACKKQVLEIVSKWDMEFWSRNVKEIDELKPPVKVVNPIPIDYDRPLVKRMLG